MLMQQANSNTKGQFANSPDSRQALVNVIIEAFHSHISMNSQALASERVQEGYKDIQLGPAQLYEALRAKGEGLRPNG